MMSRTLYLFVAIVFLFDSAAFAYRGGERRLSSYSQGTKRKLTAHKSPKAPKAPKALKAPTAPTASVDVGTPTPAPSSIIDSDTEKSELNSPSASPNIASNMTCAIDDDCGDGFFCMEKAELCCENNTTCLVFGPFTSSAPVVHYYNIMAGIVSGLVLMVTLW